MRRFPLVFLALITIAPFARSASVVAYDVSTFGSFGNDIAANTAIVQKAIDTANEAGGGRVIIPPGKPITVGSVVLKSHVELHLERGSVLLGSPHHSDFTRVAPWPISLPGDPAPRSGVILYAENAEDIAVTGGGTIDGNSPAYIIDQGTEIHTCPNARPFSVVFTRCQHITVEDITLKDASFWTFRLTGCDDALIQGIHILNDRLMPNNDGIDIDWSSNVRINACHIVTGDDCISLKTSPESKAMAHPCENIVVTNCTLISRSCAIAVGCDVEGAIRDAIFSDCVIKDSHRGIGVRLSCNGSIERIQFNNMVIETRLFDQKWWGRAEPIHILAFPWTKDFHNGVIRDIRFHNIVCRGENGAVIVSNEPGHIDQITFDDVSLLINKTSKVDGHRQDFRPNQIDPTPDIPVSGFVLRNANNVTWRNSEVTWGPQRPDNYRYLIDSQGSTNLHLDGLAGESADPKRWPAKEIH